MSNLNHNKNVWLIWGNLTSNPNVYYLPEHVLDGEAYDVLHTCHQNFVGSTFNDPEAYKAINTLREWISPEGKFAHCRVLTENHPPETLKPSKVVITGFLL